jgi:hypothetical protein
MDALTPKPINVNWLKDQIGKLQGKKSFSSENSKDPRREISQEAIRLQESTENEKTFVKTSFEDEFPSSLRADFSEKLRDRERPR